MARFPFNLPVRITLLPLFFAACGGAPASITDPEGRTQLPPAAEGTIAIVGASVVPLATETVLTNHTIVVEDGVIAALGPTGTIDVPEDAALIEGAGVWVMPGLMDMHVHLLREELEAYQRAGITTVRNMWGTERVTVLKAELEAGADHPNIYTASPGMDGDPPVWPGSVVVTDPDVAREEVRRLESEGWDFIKVYNRLTPAVYRAILSEAENRAIPVVGHIPLEVRLEDGFDTRHESIEHLTGFAELAAGGRSPAGWLEFDEVAAASAAEDLAEKGVWMCPTLVVLRHLAESRLSESQSDRARRHQLTAVSALHRAGVQLLAGTDAGLGLVPAGSALAWEIGLFVEAGLSHYEALRTATVAPARFLGVSDQLGTIEVGKRADLLLLEANPLEDLSSLTSPVGVIQRGKVLF